MWSAGLGEAQVGIESVGRNINNLRYADDTTLWQKVKSFLLKVKMRVKKLA